MNMQNNKKKGSKLSKIVLIAGLAVLFVFLLWITIYLTGSRSRIKLPIDEYSGSKSTVEKDPDSIPEYSGDDFVVLNDGIPNFNTWDIDNIKGENYSELDNLGRCRTAFAMLDRTMMPVAPRGDIGQVRPSGWKQAKYEGVIDSDPPYLYNRSHLIAYALTGQNANELNLITGTRYMNFTIMRPWEEQVMRYLNDSSNHVLYRVTPCFKGKELLARGVEMEAYSVEDQGELCFHVFIYNIQPGVVLDYATGESLQKE